MPRGDGAGAVEVLEEEAPDLQEGHGMKIYTKPGVSQLAALARKRKTDESFMTRLANQGQANGAPACSLIFSTTAMEDANDDDDTAFKDRRRTKPLEGMWQTTLLSSDPAEEMETFQFGVGGDNSEANSASASRNTSRAQTPVPPPIIKVTHSARKVISSSVVACKSKVPRACSSNPPPPGGHSRIDWARESGRLRQGSKHRGFPDLAGRDDGQDGVAVWGLLA